MLFARVFRGFRVVSVLAVANLLAAALTAQAQSGAGEGWPTYGGDAGGTRYSGSAQITRANLDKLHAVWTFHTHALDRDPGNHVFPSFENTPVLSGDTLFVTSPFNVVFALDARTGVERWHYDPKIAKQQSGGIVASRGVALWPAGADVRAETGLCSQRVFEGTLDARLIALDARTGQLCSGFGDNGSVDLTKDIHFQNIGSYGMTSPPTVVGNVVICGSVVGDNQQVDPESGAVRGYDAVTGRKLWQWEPLPWAQQQKVRTGAGNTWGVISADPALGLVYLPTGSAAPDIYGGLRPGDDRDANSLVALDAATGKKVWAFQVVHHDVWDYDIASEPILFMWRGSVPAIAVTTKMGMIFLLDRRTGEPLVPVEERPVPQGGAPGEQLSPTQPFQNIPALAPLEIHDLSVSTFHRSPEDEAFCRKQFAELRYDGLYTPPTLAGSIAYPGNLGGVNWGGAALDPATGILYADTNRLASATRLVRRHSWEIYSGKLEDLLFSITLWAALILAAVVFDSLRRRRLRAGRATLVAVLACVGVFGGSAVHDFFSPPQKVLMLDHFGYELSPQRKSPYYIERHPLLDGSGHNCTPAPWGGITAVNLNTLTKVWEKPLGTMVPGQATGVVNFGGPIVTASGLVFTGAAEDPWLRVFDAATGQELRKFALPLPGIATPMTYTLDGVQYVVIAAGGHGDGSALGDAMVAFAVR
jgi:quinoprotein glucose dehydrogenase